jgi:hypothetical protein
MFVFEKSLGKSTKKFSKIFCNRGFDAYSSRLSDAENPDLLAFTVPKLLKKHSPLFYFETGNSSNDSCPIMYQIHANASQLETVTFADISALSSIKKGG